MSIWQAILIGFFAYLGRNQVPWLFGTTGGFYGIGRPLVAGLICGVILNDVTAGVLAGVAVQAIFIGQIVPGGALPSDLNLAAFIGIPLALIAGGDAETAVALSIPLGALGVGLHNLTMTFNAVWAHKADRYAEEGNARGVRICNLLGTTIHLFERVGLVALTCYFGADFAANLINSMPAELLRLLAVFGKMLPALGFAVLLNQIITDKWMIFLFMFGWVIMTAINISTTALVIISIAIALLFVMSKDFNTQPQPALAMEGDDYEE